MNLNKILTHALFFKPEKLPNGYFKTNAAWSIVKSEKDNRNLSNITTKPSSYILQESDDELSQKASNLLYEIECSSNNYMEAIFVLIALFSLGCLLHLIPELWNYHRKNDVHLFLFVIILSLSTFWLYRKKRKAEKSLVDNFLIIDDVLERRFLEQNSPTIK